MSIKHWKIKLTAVLALLATIGSFGAYALARSHGGGEGCHGKNESATEGHHGWGGHRMGGPGHHLQGLIQELNLSPEQQKQFEQLKTEIKQEWQTQNGSHKQVRQAFKEALKAAFLQDKFAPEPLKQQWQNLRAQVTPPTDKIAQNLVKVWGILTPAQRIQVEAKLDKMSGRIKGMMRFPMTDKMMAKGFPPMRHLLAALDLNDQQKEQLQALVNQKLPEMKAQMTQALQVKDQVLAELKQSPPNPTDIATLLKKAHGEFMGGIDRHLDAMGQVHDILTPEQRQAMVEKMDKHHRHHE